MYIFPLQSQKAVSANFTSMEILSFGLAEQYSNMMSDSYGLVTLSKSHPLNLIYIHHNYTPQLLSAWPRPDQSA